MSQRGTKEKLCDPSCPFVVEKRGIMQRYIVSQFDGSTFVIIDQKEKREVCVCSEYDERGDARERADKIAKLLNESISE